MLKTALLKWLKQIHIIHFVDTVKYIKLKKLSSANSRMLWQCSQDETEHKAISARLCH